MWGPTATRRGGSTLPCHVAKKRWRRNILARTTQAQVIVATRAIFALLVIAAIVAIVIVGVLRTMFAILIVSPVVLIHLVVVVLGALIVILLISVIAAR